MTGLRINVADLLHHAGARRTLHLESAVTGLETSAARVDTTDAVVIDLVLERVSDGVVVHGTVGGTWRAECRRCLRPMEQAFELDVRELFEASPLEGETYPLEHEEIDLALPVRDTVLLELPPAPLCRDDCLGLCPTCGVDRNDETCPCAAAEIDPRWAALQQLEL